MDNYGFNSNFWKRKSLNPEVSIREEKGMFVVLWVSLWTITAPSIVWMEIYLHHNSE